METWWRHSGELHRSTAQHSDCADIEILHYVYNWHGKVCTKLVQISPMIFLFKMLSWYLALQCSSPNLEHEIQNSMRTVSLTMQLAHVDADYN